MRLISERLEDERRAQELFELFKRDYEWYMPQTRVVLSCRCDMDEHLYPLFDDKVKEFLYVEKKWPWYRAVVHMGRVMVWKKMFWCRCEAS